MFCDNVLVPSRRVKMSRLLYGPSHHPVIPVASLNPWDGELCASNKRWILLVPTGGLT